MNLRLTAAGLAGGYALLLTACPHPPDGPDPVPKHPGDRPPVVEVTPDMEQKGTAILERLEQAVKSNDKPAIAELEQSLLTTYTATSAAATRRFQQAKAALNQKDLEQTAGLLRQILVNNPAWDGIQDARLQLVEVLIELRRIDEAVPLLQTALAQEERAHILRHWQPILIDGLKAIGRGAEALQALLTAYDKESDGTRKKQLAQKILAAIDSGIGPTVIRTLYETLKDDERYEFPFALIGYKLAKVLYHVRDYENAQSVVKEIQELAASDPWSARANDVTTLLAARLQTSPKTIGVVLPLSGRHQLYGETALTAIKLAFSRYSQLTLKIRDSKSEPRTAANAVEELVLQEHVIAIIGPMMGRASKAAALKAEDLEVPIVLLAYQDGLPQLGRYVFRNALTAAMQAKGIAKVAYDSFGYCHFAILYPSTSFGRSMKNSFWEEMERRKCEIRAVESYPHDEKNFQIYIKRMSGRYWVDARETYRQGWREIRARRLPRHRQNQMLEKLRKNLQPAVDFDAILIPDYYMPIGLIAPAIAFEDIILTRDEEELKKIKKATGRRRLRPVTLMGGSGWNHPETVKRGGKFVENSVFVDGFYLDNPATHVVDFVTAFREKTEAAPRLPDAQAYDSAGLVGAVLDQAHPSTRAAMRTALLENKNYIGVTGKITFGSDGEGHRDLFVFTVKEGAIKLLTDEDIPPKPAG